MRIDWNSKVLSSLTPVIDNLKKIQINNQEILNVADWIAYEEFPSPQSNKTKKNPERLELLSSKSKKWVNNQKSYY